MVLLYKDPDGDDVFPVQTEPQITLELTQHGGTDFVDIDAFKHKIKQLEKELMKYNKEVTCMKIQYTLNTHFTE